MWQIIRRFNSCWLLRNTKYQKIKLPMRRSLATSKNDAWQDIYLSIYLTSQKPFVVAEHPIFLTFAPFAKQVSIIWNERHRNRNLKSKCVFFPTYTTCHFRYTYIVSTKPVCFNLYMISNTCSSTEIDT